MPHGNRAIARALLACSACLAACAAFDDRVISSAASPYFGQPVPGDTPAPFAAGIVDTEAIELNSVFAPNGREFFFTRVVEQQYIILHSVLGERGWSAPRPLSLYANDDRALTVDMSVSPDGTELYFLGDHPHEYAREKPGNDLWVSRRVKGGWAAAEVVPPPVRTEFDEIYSSVVADGSLYFSSDRPGSVGDRYDLYRAQRLPDGKFAEPVRVGSPISNEAGVGDTFVAPNESYMILSSRRPPSEGSGDLFCSFRQSDGSWSEPQSLGPTIDTAQHEFCPMMTPDGAYLFFSRRYGDTWETTKGGDVFWVDARVIERLRPPTQVAR